MRIATIGFTRKPARRFFGLLREARVKRVLDVRLNNASQLSGFAKRDDLAWFLGELAGIDYLHLRAWPRPRSCSATTARSASIGTPTRRGFSA